MRPAQDTTQGTTPWQQHGGLLLSRWARCCRCCRCCLLSIGAVSATLSGGWRPGSSEPTDSTITNGPAVKPACAIDGSPLNSLIISQQQQQQQQQQAHLTPLIPLHTLLIQGLVRITAQGCKLQPLQEGSQRAHPTAPTQHAANVSANRSNSQPQEQQQTAIGQDRVMVRGLGFVPLSDLFSPQVRAGAELAAAAPLERSICRWVC